MMNNRYINQHLLKSNNIPLNEHQQQSDLVTKQQAEKIIMQAFSDLGIAKPIKIKFSHSMEVATLAMSANKINVLDSHSNTDIEINLIYANSEMLGYDTLIYALAGREAAHIKLRESNMGLLLRMLTLILPGPSYSPLPFTAPHKVARLDADIISSSRLGTGFDLRVYYHHQVENEQRLNAFHFVIYKIAHLFSFEPSNRNRVRAIQNFSDINKNSRLFLSQTYKDIQEERNSHAKSSVLADADLAEISAIKRKNILTELLIEEEDAIKEFQTTTTPRPS